MGQSSKPAPPIGGVEKILLGFLAMVFAATLVGSLLMPREMFRFIPDREPSLGRLDPEIAFGPALKVSVARVRDTATLRHLLRQANYDPAAIRDGQQPAPPLFLATLPDDLAAVASVKDRKDLFIGVVLPLILQANSIILERRARLADLMNHSPTTLSESNRRWLLRLAQLYRAVSLDAGFDAINAALLAKLYRRVDEVPVSLALAQSAAESGWGTSRFARQGNALFGQWTWNEDAGLIPDDREDGRTHAVRAFSRLGNSVRAYMHNLNVSHHYSGFRAARARLREGGAPDGRWGRVLIGHLGKYSEEGAEYIEKIRVIMRVNRFGKFESAYIAPDIVPSDTSNGGG